MQILGLLSLQNQVSHRQTNFKVKTITRDREGHYIMITDSIREDIKIINIYAPNIRAPQSIMRMLIAIKGEIDSNTIIVRSLNTTHTYG